MTSKESLERIKDDIEIGYLSTKHDNQKDKNNYLVMLESIEKDLDRLEELVDKETPKEPISIKNFLNDLSLCCPRCQHPIIVWSKYKSKYCHYCGQKLKWDYLKEE